MYNNYFAQTESEWWPTQGEISTAETVAETVLPLLLAESEMPPRPTKDGGVIKKKP